MDELGHFMVVLIKGTLVFIVLFFAICFMFIATS